MVNELGSSLPAPGIITYCVLSTHEMQVLAELALQGMFASIVIDVASAVLVEVYAQ